MEIRTLPLDHLGLVAGVFDLLDIADLIDDRIPKIGNHNLEHSEIIKPAFRINAPIRSIFRNRALIVE
jgi:hypothetical protein